MKPSLLFAKAQKWAGGLGLHENALALVHHTQGTINSALGNARQGELSFQTARSGTLAASNHLLEVRGTALLYAEKARTNLRTFLGERWSTAWAQAGFTNRTLRLPRNTPEALNLLRTLQTYFTAHPTHQNMEAGVTAAAAQAHITVLDQGTTILNNARSNQRTKRDARENTQKSLREGLAGSRNEVEAVLPQNDPRWLDFVERVPSDVRSPEAVSAVVAEPGLPGHVRLSFLPSLRATRYAIEAAVGPDGEFAVVATVQDTVADLTFPPGAVVRIRVRARNAAGEAGPSPVVEVTVPVAAAA